MELTILMPCLNESETIAICVQKAKRFLTENNIDGEVLVSDNGSTDGSQDIARREGARVVSTDIKGYGSALMNGTKEALGEYVIMGDADDSYDFLHLMPFIEKLREGYDLVMGDRFAGGIEKGAMPFSHRYIGNPILSFIGRLFFRSKIRDFHCGLRGFRRDSILALGLHTTGMEYASEMVVMSELNRLKIAEVPTTLKKDGRSGKPHLRSFRDGWRHLKFLLMYAPNWLFLYPGIFFIIAGVGLGTFLAVNELTLRQVTLGIHTLLYCACAVLIGMHIIGMYLIVKTYTYNIGLVPRGTKDWNKRVSEDGFIFWGALLAVVGIALSIYAVIVWKGLGYGDLNPEKTMRLTIPAVFFLESGIQLICTGFIIGIVKIKHK